MSMEKQKPQRMCLACRTMKDKNDLVRIVKSPEGIISLDFSSKKSGRGAYICKEIECMKKCIKQRAINRAFKCAVDNEVYDKLLEEFVHGKG